MSLGLGSCLSQLWPQEAGGGLSGYTTHLSPDLFPTCHTDTCSCQVHLRGLGGSVRWSQGCTLRGIGDSALWGDRAHQGVSPDPERQMQAWHLLVLLAHMWLRVLCPTGAGMPCVPQQDAQVVQQPSRWVKSGSHLLLPLRSMDSAQSFPMSLFPRAHSA